MKWMTKALLIAVAGGMLMGNVARADEEQAAPAEDEIKQLREQIQALRNEVAALRAQMGMLMRTLNEVKAAVGGDKPTRPKQAAADKVYDIPVGDSPIRGPEDAPVTITEYASFACGWCIREVPTLTQVMEAYPNKVKWVFKHFPMWEKAQPAHAAAALAYNQLGTEGFWKMHDKIIEGGTRKLSKPDLRKYAEEIGMNMDEFDAVMNDDAEMKKLALQDTPRARSYGVRGTPSIFINGKKLQGRRTVDNYKSQIDAALKEVREEKKGG